MLTILDTSVLLHDHVHGVSGDLCVSTVSFAELHFGVLVAPDDAERARRLARFSALMERFEAIPVTRAVASSYGELAAATHRTGRKAQSRTMDLMIAATAHAYGARLATADVADVEHLAEYIDIVTVRG